MIDLFTEVDGRFPNHHPDPTIPEYMRALIEKVKETGAEVGTGYDGDADRIGAVDHLGNIIWGDQLMILFSATMVAIAATRKVNHNATHRSFLPITTANQRVVIAGNGKVKVASSVVKA